MEEHNYCVYMHTSPSGKRYIGITGATEKTKKQIYCYETDSVYSCAKEAGEQLGIKTIEHIRACCTGGRKSAGGYHFCHIEERMVV